MSTQEGDKTSVLIVDDHQVVIEGITTLLSEKGDFEIAGALTDSREALSTTKSVKPDIVVLDVSMPHLDGIEVARDIKAWDESVKILVYSMSSSKEHITAMFREGASGYVLKDEPLSELFLALQAVSEGGTFYSSAVRKTLQEHMKELELGECKDVAEVQNGIAKLSVREKEVFVLLADGLTVKDVAERLCISPKTVESHKYNIMDKLGLKSLAQFTKIAAKKHLIEI
jgi:DNA-binding NarL/FixJ family response regulator